jgi:hypothetical protein
MTRRTLVCYDSLTHLCHWHWMTVYYLPVYINDIRSHICKRLFVFGATAPVGHSLLIHEVYR